MNSPLKDLLKKRHYNFDLGPLVKGMRFYWVPLILLLVPILYIMGYGMHFYSAEPEYFLGADEVLASSFSGYELEAKSPWAFGFLALRCSWFPRSCCPFIPFSAA